MSVYKSNKIQSRHSRGSENQSRSSGFSRGKRESGAPVESAAESIRYSFCSSAAYTDVYTFFDYLLLYTHFPRLCMPNARIVGKRCPQARAEKLGRCFIHRSRETMNF